MKSAHDSRGDTKATPGVRIHAHRPGGAVLVMVLAALLAALLPNAAHAHYVEGANGVGGAEIDVTPDGYDEPVYLTGRTYVVNGRSFNPNDLALVFQCPVTRTPDLHLECQLVGLAPTDASGNFRAEVHMQQTFVSVLRPASPTLGFQQGGNPCYGRDYTNAVGTRSFQCSVVAMTYGRSGTTINVSKLAEHWICFEGMWSGSGQYDTKCLDQPPDM